MKRTLVKNVEVNEQVYLKGWVHRIKKLKAVAFVILRDRSGLIQVAMAPDLLGGLRLESIIEVRGRGVKNPNKYGLVEVQAQAMTVLSSVEEDLPIKVNDKDLEVGLDTILSNRVLALRHEKEQAIFKIQACLSQGFKDFLSGEDFIEIHTPKLVKEGAEGGSEVFSLDYFGQKAYLAQSPQFYKQMMVISGLERVYEVGPVFRAESHSTVRHINEYTSMDLELGFIESEEDLMTLETRLLTYMLGQVETKCGQALETLATSLPQVPKEIPRMKLQEAIDWVNKTHGKSLEGDLDPEGEQLIYQHMYEKTGSEFLFLTHFPKKKRPMYTLACGDLTHSFDLLFRGLEITTGGMRIHELESLKASMVDKGLEVKDYQSYLQAFRYGVPSHGGLAIGLERLTAKLLNFSNIRRACLFPRDKTRLTP